MARSDPVQDTGARSPAPAERLRHLEEILTTSRLYLERGLGVEVADLLADGLVEGIRDLLGSTEPHGDRVLRAYLTSRRPPDPILDDAVTLALRFRLDRSRIGGVARTDLLCLMGGLGRLLMLLERSDPAVGTARSRGPVPEKDGGGRGQRSSE